MRNVSALLLCVMFLPGVSFGRGQLFQLGVSGGFSSARMGDPVFVTQDGPLWGYHVTAKGLADFRWVQLGVGVEVGSITGDITRIVDVTGGGMFQPFYFPEKSADITGFYKAPHGLLNIKINVTHDLYFFGGGVGGIMLGESDLIQDDFNSLFYGVNVGLVVNLGQHLALEIHEGWRHIEVGATLTPASVGGPTVSLSEPPYYTGHTLNYFTTNIGLRIRFGSNENRWYR